MLSTANDLMALTPLTALSPLDGRDGSKVEPLRRHFSELGLIGYRVRIEVEWLKALAAEPGIKEVPAFSAATIRQLDAIVWKFSEADGAAVKSIEARRQLAQRNVAGARDVAERAGKLLWGSLTRAMHSIQPLPQALG